MQTESFKVKCCLYSFITARDENRNKEKNLFPYQENSFNDFSSVFRRKRISVKYSFCDRELHCVRAVMIIPLEIMNNKEFNFSLSSQERIINVKILKLVRLLYLEG